MFKHTVFLRIGVCLSCLFLFTVGCDKKAEAPAKSGGVVKKITVAEKKTPEAAPAATTAVSQAPPPVKQAADMTDTATATSTANIPQPEPPKYMPELAVGYDPKGRIDPFIPLIKDEPVKAAKETEKEGGGKKAKVRDKRVPQTPLEKIELNQLRLRAIIIAPSGNRALVEESSGKGYIITKGTYIGSNEGVVTDIFKDKVIVEETIRSIQGDVTTQEKELKLPKPPGEE